MDLLPKDPHCGLVCGATNCGKTEFILNLLETKYLNHFENIVIFCPTVRHNKTYQDRGYIWTDDNIYIANPRDKLNELLEYFYNQFQGEETLFIIDDCSAEKDIVKKRNTLSMIAFSGRHVKISVWILTQKYNAVLTDFREQLKFIALFYSKDRDSFESCLRENDVMSKHERELAKDKLKSRKHSKLILKTDQPTGYAVL